ncbi:MAG: CRISPR-associated helicase Cas3' [Armatimonadota bacterium]
MHVAEAYQRLFGIDRPYTHQARLFEAARQGAFPLLLRAPCGTGKTQAAAAPWLSQFLDGDFILPPRLIYVLPTQALCNQIAQRLAESARAAHGRLVARVQHGAAPNDAMLFADIAVTTLDHFVYAYARSSSQVRGHIDLPAGCMAHALVVFDEAHLYQSGFTFSVMRAMLEILNAAGVPFIVMTATMPRSLRESFGERLDFTEVEFGGEAMEREIELHRCLDRPLLHDGALDAQAQEAIAAARRTLIVVNTVASAQEVYRLLDGPAREDVALIHSRYTVADRARHEAGAIALLRSEGIVVSTQVCEAGLDVSADLLITEMAPADSIIQRAGRCARLNHGHPKGTVLVYCPAGHPYAPEHMAATESYLREHADLDLADWQATCDFADQMPYVADDIAARDSLFDLYEATLYADHRPCLLAVREGKYLFAWHGDVEALGKPPDEAAEAFRAGQITLAFETALGLGYHKASGDEAEREGVFARKSNGYQEVRYNRKDRAWKLHRMGNLLPLSTYLLREECYDAELGVVGDGD